jgi:hypothetical protein
MSTTKTQPCKSHWPPDPHTKIGLTMGKKASERLEVDGTNGSGREEDYDGHEAGSGLVARHKLPGQKSGSA